MGSEWKETTLGEICKQQGGSIQTGPFGSQLHASDYQAKGIPVVMPVNLVGGRIDEKGIARVSLAEAERLVRHKLNIGDIVFSRRGDVTRFALVSENEFGWLCGTGCLKVSLGRQTEAIPGFIAGALAAPDTKEWLTRHAVGATMPNLNTEILSAIPVSLPPIEEQRTIAHILGTLDDKIELNRKQNKTLEEMARALFKAWFVDFEPVRAKMEGRWQPGQSLPGLPAHLYDLFPDRLVESELGEIPDGWGVGSLGQVAVHPRRSVQPSEIKDETPYIALEHMPKRSIALAEWGAAQGLESSKYEFKRGEILFGKLRPYFHKVGVAPVDGVCSTDAVVIAPRQPLWFGFVLAHASSDAFVEYTNAGSTGTKMPRTNWTEMV